MKNDRLKGMRRSIVAIGFVVAELLSSGCSTIAPQPLTSDKVDSKPTPVKIVESQKPKETEFDRLQKLFIEKVGGIKVIKTELKEILYSDGKAKINYIEKEGKKGVLAIYYFNNESGETGIVLGIDRKGDGEIDWCKRFRVENGNIVSKDTDTIDKPRLISFLDGLTNGVDSRGSYEEGDEELFGALGKPVKKGEKINDVTWGLYWKSMGGSELDLAQNAYDNFNNR